MKEWHTFTDMGLANGSSKYFVQAISMLSTTKDEPKRQFLLGGVCICSKCVETHYVLLCCASQLSLRLQWSTIFSNNLTRLNFKLEKPAGLRGFHGKWESSPYFILEEQSWSVWNTFCCHINSKSGSCSIKGRASLQLTILPLLKFSACIFQFQSCKRLLLISVLGRLIAVNFSNYFARETPWPTFMFNLLFMSVYQILFSLY